MYIPKRYENTGRESITAFMKQYSFATLVTTGESGPEANHIPFTVTEKNGELLLMSHLSIANKQWQQLQNGPVLVIFTGPHAYISPSHYEKVMNVPTWNYAAVHAYGEARIVDGIEAIMESLERMIIQYDTDYLQQWRHLPDDFKHNMQNGIVAFEIRVTGLQAKYKLSQNKADNERRRIINALLNSNAEHERNTGLLMKQELEREIAVKRAEQNPE